MRIPGIEKDLARGARIRELREAEGHSRKTFAEVMHVSPRTIYAWEEEGGTMDHAKLAFLAANLHTSTEYLLHGVERKVKIPVDDVPVPIAERRLGQRFTAVEGRLATVESALADLVASIEDLIQARVAKPGGAPPRSSSKRSGEATGAKTNPPATG